MADRDVLICSPDKRHRDDVAAQFAQLGWSVQATADEAEAGYRLLMWNDPTELPTVAIVRLRPFGELLSFCSILSEEKVVDHLPIIAWLDSANLDAHQHTFAGLGFRIARDSQPAWPPIREVLIELGLHPELSQRVDSRDESHPKGRAAPRFVRNSERGISGRP